MSSFDCFTKVMHLNKKFDKYRCRMYITEYHAHAYYAHKTHEMI